MALWTPASLPGLVAWYDASDASTVTLNGSNVSQIDDKSGNGYHVSQGSAANQPAYVTGAINGLNAIQGDGVASHLENYSIPLYNPGLSAGVIQVVDNNGGGWFDATSSAGLSTLGFGLGKGNSNFDNNNFRVISIEHGVRWNTSSTFLTAGNSYLFSTSVANSDLYMDGSRIDSFSPGNVPTTGVTFGGSYDRSRTTNDYTGEWVVADTSDDAEREKLEGYLAHKWGTEASLPAAHPYKAAPPTTGGTVVNSTATVAATSNVTAAGSKSATRTANVAATSSVTATGSKSSNLTRTAAISATSSVTVSATRARTASASISAQSTITAVGDKSGSKTRTASVAAQSSFTVVPRVTRRRTALVAAQSGVTARAGGTKAGSASIAAQSSISVVGRKVLSRSSVVAAQSGFSTLYRKSKRSNASVSAQSSISTVSKRTRARTTTIAANSLVSVTPTSDNLSKRRVVDYSGNSLNHVVVALDRNQVSDRIY